MSNLTGGVRCGNCQSDLAEPAGLDAHEREPCPKCRSLKRAYDVGISGSITLKRKLISKQKRSGNQKPLQEQVVGDDLHRKTGVWNHIIRIIDRVNDGYLEHIVNPATGSVIRSVEEPLSSHQGHGSERKQTEGAGDA